MVKKTNEQTQTIDQLELIERLKLKAILFDTPESEQAKIQLIKEELSTGRYQMNSHHIAEKLVEFSPLAEEIERASPGGSKATPTLMGITAGVER